MQAITRADVTARYDEMKNKIRAAAEQNPKIEVNDGRVEVQDDVRIDGATIGAGSAFDSDDKTADSLTLTSTTAEGLKRKESFRTFQEEGGCVIKSQQNMMEYQLVESGLGGFTTQSVTFQL